MATNLSHLAIEAIDNLHKLNSLQDLLEIYLEQGEKTPEKRASRAELLISSYLDQTEPILEGLERNLETIRELIPGAGR